MGKERFRDKAKKGEVVEKIKRSIEKAGKSKRPNSVLYVDTKSVKNKLKRKELVIRQKQERHKLSKMKKMKEKAIRAEHGEEVRHHL